MIYDPRPPLSGKFMFVMMLGVAGIAAVFAAPHVEARKTKARATPGKAPAASDPWLERERSTVSRPRKLGPGKRVPTRVAAPATARVERKVPAR